jgi:hypothetical protein
MNLRTSGRLSWLDAISTENVGGYLPFEIQRWMTIRELPMINLNGEDYFFDFRLSQLRATSEPHRFINLSATERKEIDDAIRLLRVVSDPSFGRGLDQ